MLKICTNVNDLSYEIKRLIKVNGYTQKSLAEKMNENVLVINRLCNNKVQVINDRFLNLLDFLGYDVKIDFVRKEG